VLSFGGVGIDLRDRGSHLAGSLREHGCDQRWDVVVNEEPVADARDEPGGLAPEDELGTGRRRDRSRSHDTTSEPALERISAATAPPTGLTAAVMKSLPMYCGGPFTPVGETVNTVAGSSCGSVKLLYRATTKPLACSKRSSRSFHPD
jgi:hypothetical protein